MFKRSVNQKDSQMSLQRYHLIRALEACRDKAPSVSTAGPEPAADRQLAAARMGI